jgi:hypothetical protein
MTRSRFTKPIGVIAALLAGLLFAILAVPLGAQPATETRVAHGFGPVYDAAHEITINGTIQEIVTKRTVHSPVGMHLLVAGPEGLVDAHLGPFLSKKTKEALHEGMPVKIVGAMTAVDGRDYLFARLLTVGENTITVRSPHGFLVHGQPPQVQRSDEKVKTHQSEINGGVR